MYKLQGVGVALVTPFKKNLSVDHAAIGRLIEYNIEGGTDFFVVLGTTAEAATLTTEEKQSVIETIVKVNAGRKPLVLGIGGNDTMSVKRTIEATDLSDFTAILSVSPYYNKPNQEGIYQHYRLLAETGKDIILYNVPGRTGQNVETETTLRMANEFSNIFAIKEASPNILQHMDILRLRPKGFAVFSGDDELTLPISLAGGQGVISVLGQAYPTEFRTMLNLAKQNKVEEAYNIHNRMVNIIRLIFQEGNPCGIKKVLAEKGLIEEHLRLPLVPVTQSLSERIINEMKNLKN